MLDDPPPTADDPAGSPADSPGWESEFERFVARHSAELGRLAYLMSGEQDAADDLAADALLAAWRQWATVRDADSPLAYVRRMVINLAATRVRRLVRERRRLMLFRGDALEPAPGRDSAAVVDVRAALGTLPARRRACLVLRYAFDLAEQDVAELLGINVGTVKSQTAKGAEQLRRALGSYSGEVSDVLATRPPGNRRTEGGRPR